MSRDLLKTIGGLALIAAIVVATFLYGNKQRQEQVRRDQEIKQQQQTAKEKTLAQDKATKPDGPSQVTAPGATGTSSVGGGVNQPTTTPQTGPELYLLPLGAIAGLHAARRYTKKQLVEALRA